MQSSLQFETLQQQETIQKQSPISTLPALDFFRSEWYTRSLGWTASHLLGRHSKHKDGSTATEGVFLRHIVLYLQYRVVPLDYLPEVSQVGFHEGCEW